MKLNHGYITGYQISLSHLIKITTESPKHLSDHRLEQIVNVWNRKPTKIAVYYMYYTGADLEWWGGMTNAHNKNVGHAHFIKTTPIFIAQQGSTMTADCTTVWRVVSQLV